MKGVSISLNCKNHNSYRIIAESGKSSNGITMAGFCAEERAEDTLLRHLHNMCVQSNGSVSNAFLLLNNLLQQWQTTFNIPAAQVLKTSADMYDMDKLKSVSVYRMQPAAKEEKLVKRIFL